MSYGGISGLLSNAANEDGFHGGVHVRMCVCVCVLAKMNTRVKPSRESVKMMQCIYTHT